MVRCLSLVNSACCVLSLSLWCLSRRLAQDSWGGILGPTLCVPRDFPCAAATTKPAEPSWHRRQRLKRTHARTLVRAVQAATLLRSHHSSMGGGKWNAPTSAGRKRPWIGCKCGKSWIYHNRLAENPCCKVCGEDFEAQSWSPSQSKSRSKTPQLAAAASCPDPCDAIGALLADKDEEGKKRFFDQFPAFAPKAATPKPKGQLYIELLQSQSRAEKHLTACSSSVEKAAIVLSDQRSKQEEAAKELRQVRQEIAALIEMGYEVPRPAEPPAAIIQGLLETLGKLESPTPGEASVYTAEFKDSMDKFKAAGQLLVAALSSLKHQSPVADAVAPKRQKLDQRPPDPGEVQVPPDDVGMEEEEEAGALPVAERPPAPQVANQANTSSGKKLPGMRSSEEVLLELARAESSS